MRARRAPPLLVLLVAVLAAMLVACTGADGGPSLVLRDWTLQAPDAPPTPLHLPAAFWSKVPRRPCTYVLRTSATLPDALRGRELTLTLPRVEAFATLRVDREALDPLDRGLFDRVRPSARQLVFRIPARLTGRERLPLALEVQHRDFFTASIGRAPRLEATPYGDAAARAGEAISEAFGIAVAAVFLLLALTSFATFVVDRRRVAAGWYALMTAGVLGWDLVPLGVTQLADPRDLIRVPIATTTVICIAAIAFTHAHLASRPPPRWIVGVIAALGVASLTLGWHAFSSYAVPDLLLETLVVVTLVYQVVLLAGIARRGPRRVDAAWMLGAWLFVGLAALADRFALPLAPALVAWLVFVLVQAALLVRAHTESLRSLNAALEVRVGELEDRNRDVARLNDELRRQVGDRSARLAEALSHIGRLAGRVEPLAPGALLNDRYRVARKLGEGAMGAVYEVERTTDGRRLALKTVMQAHSGESLARLAREAEAAAKVVHPNVVGIVDIDVAPSGVLFLVMELVRGRALSDCAQRFGDVAWATAVLAQVAAGLRALHDAGVVHRDLKPANVLLEQDGDGPPRAKIADFGIARLSGGTTDPAHAPEVDPQAATIQAAAHDTERASDAAGLTQTGVVMGTPLYMAPELLRGSKDAPPASDMWSFGVMACEVLSGSLPFESSPVQRALEGRRSAPPPPMLPPLPSPLADVVERCLARDPALRPTAAEVYAALLPPAPHA